MRKIIEEKISKSPSGCDLVIQKVKWEPINESFEEREITPEGDLIIRRSHNNSNSGNSGRKSIPKVTVVTSPNRKSKI